MSARKTKAAKASPTPARVPYIDRHGFDLTTVEGSHASEEDYKRRKAIAEDFHGERFSDIEKNLDDLDKLLISVMCDLTEQPNSDGTVLEVARIARLSFMIRLQVPTTSEEAVTP